MTATQLSERKPFSTVGSRVASAGGTPRSHEAVAKGGRYEAQTVGPYSLAAKKFRCRE